MRNGFLLMLAVLALAASAVAQTSINGFSDCGPLGSAVAKTDLKVTNKSGTLCFDFDSGFTAGSESLSFSVHDEKATICLNQNRLGTAGSAIVDIQVCGGDERPAVISDNTCADTVPALPLTTTGHCEAVATGVYRLQVPTAASGTEDAQVTIHGYGTKR